MEGGEAETGIIESVHLKNFMCHADYKIDLSPHVNIILGRNGSGKSSILSAIQIALGGKASSSGRSVVLKNTVQKGKQVAEVAVTLRNSKDGDAFQYDKYGPQITIERRITVEGASSYKLKDTKGNVISTKKEDLNAILSAFNIQVNNPLAILTQEMSKTFLNSKDPKEKYNLFLHATQVAQLENIYKLCEGQMNHVQMILESKEQSLDILKNEMKDLDEQIKKFHSIEDHREQLNKLYEEFVWAIAHEKEQLAEKLGELVETRASEVEIAAAKLEDVQKRYDDAVKLESHRTQLAAKLNEELKSLCQSTEVLWNQVKEIENQKRELQTHLKVYERDILIKQKDIKILESRIQECRSEENVQKERLEIKENTRACTMRKESYITLRDEMQQKLESAKISMQEKRQEFFTKDEEFQALNLQISATERELEKLNRLKSNHLFAYGRNMPALLQRIRAAVSNGVFKREPIGPLGLYVKVKEPKWYLAVECCLSNVMLKSFLCDNFDDQERLLEIMQEIYPNQATPQIITSKFITTVHDVRNRRVYSDCFPSVIDMIDATDPVILNCLIDEKGIENILLVPIAAVARNIMMNDPPPKCKEMFTAKGNSVHPYPTYRFYSNRKKTSTLIAVKSNLDASIKEKHHQLEALKKSRNTSEVERNALNSELSFLVETVDELEERIGEYSSLINKEQVELQTLEDTEVSDAGIALEAELNKVKNLLENLLNQKTILEEEIFSKNDQLRHAKTAVANGKKQHFQKTTELEMHIQRQITQSYRSTKRISKEKEIKQESYEKLRKKLEEAKDEYQNQLSTKDEEVALAERVCPRINTVKKPEVLQASINEVKILISEAEKIFPNKDQIIHSFCVKQSEHHKIVTEISSLKKTVKKFRDTMQSRLKAFEDIRVHICLRVNLLFTTIIVPQGYYGNLKFNHENRTLDIKAKMGKDIGGFIRSLSGGEKSFITVALLLALWDAVELPFRVMDEYDVFMDQVNRKRSMDLMILTALERTCSQFIFFSPQNLTKMRPSAKIKIFQLPNPGRKAPKKRKKKLSAVRKRRAQ